MDNSNQIDSDLLAPPDGVTTRAMACRDDTAQPPLASGFGAVMEQEQKIQSFTEEYIGADNGPHSAAIDRILRQQQTRLGANIALLEQRYEMLPPARIQTRHAKHPPLSYARRIMATPDDSGVLQKLVAQHLDLIRNIETLIDQRPDGQRGTLILAEIARNHEDMAWMLTALLKEEDSVRDLVPIPVTA